MRMSELTDYAEEKYQIREQHKWADFPGFSVLEDPHTGKWIALLMRQWDTETGTEIERCDLKCGREHLPDFRKPYLSSPIRMHGRKWIDIAFDDRTEADVVFLLFDKAVADGKKQGYTIVLESQVSAGESAYRDTALPFSGSTYRAAAEAMPERLREMRRLFEYGRESTEAKAKNFYRQAVLMQDYEDDAPWSGEFLCYYPTYQDLTVRQLRGYFTWRTQVRRGEYQPIATSAAYLYLYELLNGIGCETPEDALQKMKAFEAGYLDSGVGDSRMKRNLRRWMLEYAVLHDLPPELAREAADPDTMERDAALSVLRTPDKHTDEEVFSALCRLEGKKLAASPVLASAPEKGPQLFAKMWRAASAYRWQGEDLFTLCFGQPRTRQWYPLANALVYQAPGQEDRDYALNDSRSYRRHMGIWQTKAYEKQAFDRERFHGFLHEADARLRRYLKTGRYLRENPGDAWAIPYIDAVIEEDRQAVLEESRPKITIDLSGLEQIRKDAITTRDSLLTEEELEDAYEAEEAAANLTEEEQADIPLDPVQIRILCALLHGESVDGLLKENHLMPSIAADFINEALFDEIGDTVLLCEDDRLSLAEDYTEDLEQLLGGYLNG